MLLLSRTAVRGRAAATALGSNKRRAAAVVLATIFVCALVATTSFRALSRESDAAAHAAAHQQERQQQKQQQQQQQLFQAERAALGPSLRAVDSDADFAAALVRAARASGDNAVAALARDLERAAGHSRSRPWPLAVARAQMRAALDLASANAAARAEAEARAQDEAEALAAEARFAEAEAALLRSKRDSGTARRRRRSPAGEARARKPASPPPPPAIAREHARGWAFARRAAQLLAERAAEAAGSLAPIPCGDGGSGDATLPGLAGGALLAVTMARDVDGGGGGGGSTRSAAAAAASSAANAAWQVVRLAARTPHGRLAVSLAVLLDEQLGEEEEEERRRGAGKTKERRGQGKGKRGATAAAEAAARVQAAERARHLRASAALLRLALAALGVECRASELRLQPSDLAAAAAAGAARNASTAAQRVAAMAAALDEVGGGGGGSGGGQQQQRQPQPPFVGQGAALARNAAVDAYLFPPPPSSVDGHQKTKQKKKNKETFLPDAVLFADARAFFCAEDALRLLSYPARTTGGGGGVDLACALPLVEDPWPDGSSSSSSSSSSSGSGSGIDDGALPFPPSVPPAGVLSAASLFAGPPSRFDDDAMAEAAAAARAHPDVPSRLRLRSLRADAAADAARDVRGSALSPLPPFLVHADSAALARQGQPFPVRCCWGGLARVAAWPFRRGLRFRAAAASSSGGQGGGGPAACSRPYHEASVLCEDLDRLSGSWGAGPLLSLLEEEEEVEGSASKRGSNNNATAPPSATGRGGGGGPARALLDPAVRTSPQARVRHALAHRRFPYYYYTRMELGTSWRADVGPLLVLPPPAAAAATAVARPGSGGGGEAGMVFWPTPTAGRTAAGGGMWQPTIRRMACCEAPLPYGRPNLDCWPVKMGRGGTTRAFLEACSRRKKGDAAAPMKMFCPGAALERVGGV